MTFSSSFLQLFKKHFVVGLDIGTNSIKIVQFAKKDSGLQMVHSALGELPADGDPAAAELHRVAVLKDLLKDIPISQTEFHVTVNCPLTMIRVEILPLIPKSELKEGIRFEAKNYFPYSLENALWDFEILGGITEKGVQKQKVMMAASPRKTADGILSLLTAVGVQPSLFIPVPLALQKMIRASHPKEDEVIALLDIGAQFAELVIFQGENFIFQRKLPIAAGDFTKAMMTALVSDRGRVQLSAVEAEKIKRLVGIPSAETTDRVEDPLSSAQILSMIRGVMEQLVSEINRCFDYYRENTKGKKVNTLVLMGGGALLKGLPAFLSKELDVVVKLDEPASHRFAAAIGAAFSAPRGVNLLPPEIKDESKRTYQRALIQSVIVAVPLIAVLTYTGMGIQLVNYEKRIEVAQAEYERLRPQAQEAREAKWVEEILSAEPYWEDVFKQMGVDIPGNIALTEWDKRGDSMTLKGKVIGDGREEALSGFIASLEKGIFKNVKLVMSRGVPEESTNQFELTCWVD